MARLCEEKESRPEKAALSRGSGVPPLFAPFAHGAFFLHRAFGEGFWVFGGASPSSGDGFWGFGDASPRFGDDFWSFGGASPDFGDGSPSFGDASPDFPELSGRFGDASPNGGEFSRRRGEASPNREESAGMSGDASPQRPECAGKWVHPPPRVSKRSREAAGASQERRCGGFGRGGAESSGDRGGRQVSRVM